MSEMENFAARMVLCAAITIAGSSAHAQSKPVATVEPFKLGDVQLLEGPFKTAMERNAAYLLRLEPDRFLHNTRKYAGLEPKGALYGGWESQGIAGHSLGHYLTALAQQFAATGDTRFKERIDYIVAEMAECQKAYGDGYVGALPPLELAALRGLKEGKVEPAGGFNFKGGAWVPWYTQHKILAGLRDAWTLGGNAQAKEVTLRLADWVDTVTAGLTPDQQQLMLSVEHGGMKEVLVDLHARTGQPKYLETANRFHHRAVVEPLAAGRDELAGKHANTQIPKMAGEAVTYEVTGDPAARKTAEFFWDTVVRRHSWVNGGNSDGEHFFPDGTAASHLSPATAESCNTYNMLRLTRHLFTWRPDVQYTDYYERALYNHILASQEPREGMFTYFVSLKPGHFKTYSTPFDSFWCCVGSGMENHTKYGESIYFHGADDVYVSLFIPSVLTWREKNLVLEQRTDYPRSDRVELTVKSAPATPLTLRVRSPAWAEGPLAFQLNGKRLKAEGAPGTYAAIERKWKAGDRLTITIPMRVRTEPLPGSANQVALLYGPVVLAGVLGPAPPSETFPYAKEQNANFKAPVADVPTLTGDHESVARALKRESPRDLTFRTVGIGEPDEVTLKPFADVHYERYNVYWTLVPKREQ
jgi:DUF1680 family protein